MTASQGGSAENNANRKGMWRGRRKFPQLHRDTPDPGLSFEAVVLTEGHTGGGGVLSAQQGNEDGRKKASFDLILKYSFFFPENSWSPETRPSQSRRPEVRNQCAYKTRLRIFL